MFLINTTKTIFLASLALAIAGCVAGNPPNSSSGASSSSLASAGKYCGGNYDKGYDAFYLLGNCATCHGAIDQSSGMTPGDRGMPALDPNADVYFNKNVATELALNEYIAEYMIHEEECVREKCADDIATYLHTLAGYCKKP